MPYAFVVADMEAGLEHLSWAGGTLRYADLLLVVLQPTARVLLTADRAHRLAVELGIADVAFVGNRVREADRPWLEEFAAERGRRLLGVIPHDDAVIEADQRGVCVLDHAPQSPAVQAIQQLARVLDEQHRGARDALPARTPDLSVRTVRAKQHWDWPRREANSRG